MTTTEESGTDRPGRGGLPSSLPAVLAVLGMVTVALTGCFRLWKAEAAIPFAYGDDANSHALLVKAVDDFGWYENNPNLGAPFGLTFHDFPMADNVQLFATKLIGLFTDDYGTIVNAYYLLTYVLVAMAALWVLRRLRISRPVAAVLAVLYAFLPYHFMRGELHLFLSGYYVVPLGIWFGYAVLCGCPLFTRHPTRTGLRAYATGETARTIALAALIGGTSSYYAIFTVVVVVSAAAIRLLRRLRPRTVGTALAVLLVVVASQAANLAPDLAHRRAHGANPGVAQRAASESEFYSLKLAQLLLPMPYHRIDGFASLRREYASTFPLSSEGAQIAVGAVGAVGLTWLLGLAVVGPIRGRRRHPGTNDDLRGDDGEDSAPDERPAALATLALATFLVATAGGLSTFVALFVTTQVRAWNRLSVFLAFMGLAAVGLLLDRLGRILAGRRGRRAVLAGVLATVLVLGLADQSSDSFIPDYPAVAAEFRSDEAFVEAIERTLPSRSMVFQVPIVPFPEWPPVQRMVDYSHLKGYLHSRTLRWSYGGMKGREADWQLQLVGAPVPELLTAVVAGGFRGLYVDRFGYADSGAAFEREVAALVGAQPMASANGRLAFFDLTGYERAVRAALGDQRIDELGAVVLRPTRLDYGRGFSHQEADDRNSWRWMGPRGELELANPASTSRRVRVELELATASQAPSTATISYPDGSAETLSVMARATPVRRELVLPPGRSRLVLATDAPRVQSPTDPRRIHLQVLNARVFETIREELGR